MGRCKQNNLGQYKNMGWGDLMQLTPKLNLKKPDFTNNINVQDLNDNMDVLDTAVSELQEGSVSIPDLETNDKTLAGAINEIKQTVNDVETNAQQQLKNHEADYVKHPAYAQTTFASNIYSVTLTPPLTTYQDGVGLVLKLNATPSTGTIGINVNGLGNKNVYRAKGTSANASMFVKDGIYEFRYSATANNGNGAFILQGEGGSGNAQPSEVLSGKTFTNDNGEQVGTMIKGAYIKTWQWVSGNFTIDELEKTVTLNTGVNINKSVIRVSFYSNEGISSSVLLHASFLSSLSIRVSRNQKGYNSSSYVQFVCEVIEFDDSIKLQFGGTAILNSNAVKLNITPTATNKTLLFYNYNDNTNEGGVRSMLMDYRASDHINFVRGLPTSTNLTTISWWLVEFP